MGSTFRLRVNSKADSRLRSHTLEDLADGCCRDLGQPLNLFDPKSGIGYFQAVTALAKVYRQGVTTNNFNPVSLPANVQQYWTDMLQPLQPGGAYQLGVGLGPTQTGCRTPGQLINSTTNPIVAV